jgi:hypothetical protein
MSRAHKIASMQDPEERDFARHGRRWLAGVGAVLLLAAGSAGSGSDQRVRTRMLTGPNGTDRMKEPNVAVDPADPDRIVVTAPSRTPKAAYAYYWWSRDGGRSWKRSFLKPWKPRYDIASDPALAFGPDCRVYYTHLDFGDFQKARKLEDGQWLEQGGLGLQSSDDCGKTFTPTRIAQNPPGNLQADKDWIAVDAYPASKYRGSVYVFFSFIGSLVDRRDTATDIQFVYSRDGRTFSEPRQLSQNGYVVANSVRPDGTLDAIWEERRWDSQKIWHVTSTDGGETFSAPRLVTGLEATSVLDWPVLTSTEKGTLVAAWCQRSDRSPAGRYESKIFYSVFDKDAWSPAAALEPDLPAGAWMSTPALAASEGAAWLLAYGADAKETRVTLYRAPLDTHRFTQHVVLGKRDFGVRNYCPGWLDCFDQAEQPGTKAQQFSPGDYVGLSGAGKRVVAAYVLPRRNDLEVTKLPTLYVSIVEDSSSPD